MANSLYDEGRRAFLSGEIDWGTDTIKAALLRSSHTPDLALHGFYVDVLADTVGTPVVLGNKSAVDGVADADDVTFTAVPGPEQIGYILLYKDTGVTATSPLIGLIDTATGLPVTPNGGDIDINWDNGANKIYRL